MKRLIILTASILLLTVCASCVSSPVQGILFTGTEQHVYMTGGSQIGSGQILKRGQSCSFGSYLFGFFLVFYGAGGSTADAMTNGGITKIGSVDRSSLSILGPIFYRECVVVWGE